MKIATLSFQRVCNYGAILQLYALQRIISEMKYETELLDYDNREIFGYSITERLRMMLDPSWQRQEKAFHSFKDKYIRISERICSLKALSIYAQKYDRVVVGSDQVWNYIIIKRDGAYFLDYLPDDKRCSYAASFGISEIPEEVVSFYQKHLRGFRNYSVREKTGAKLVKQLIGGNAVVDLDPVGLLTTEQWEKLIVPPKEQGYIFMYMPSSGLRNYARNFSKATGKKVVCIGGKSYLHPSQNIGEIHDDAGPEEFLSLLYHADHVVTGSFHATIFSILFNKDFHVSVPPQVGSRIMDLLEDFCLTDHIVHSAEFTGLTKTDWQRVNAYMGRRRVESLNHLTGYLE